MNGIMKFRLLFIIAVVAVLAYNLNAQISSRKNTVTELFNGKDFTGWKFCMAKNSAPENTWSVSDSLIHCTGKPNGYIRTEKIYSNFQVTIQWRFITPGNSGVMVFMQEPDQVWPRCVECQGMHDHQGDFWLWGGVGCAKPSVTQNNGIIMQESSAENPVGEWNIYQVICRGNSVEIIVNGKSMNKITECNVSSGFIGLQSEGADLEIRRVAVELLKN
jgi:hypothetical protein